MEDKKQHSGRRSGAGRPANGRNIMKDLLILLQGMQRLSHLDFWLSWHKSGNFITVDVFDVNNKSTNFAFYSFDSRERQIDKINELAKIIYEVDEEHQIYEEERPEG